MLYDGLTLFFYFLRCVLFCSLYTLFARHPSLRAPRRAGRVPGPLPYTCARDDARLARRGFAFSFRRSKKAPGVAVGVFFLRKWFMFFQCFK